MSHQPNSSFNDDVRGGWPAPGQVFEPSRAIMQPAPVETFMVGNSPAMLEVFEQIRRFAVCDVPVLITGESGTGKELAARAIHDRSRRGNGPYVAINCAAVPATLIASELFGYEKGAFTGATARKRGQIEHAHGGTLFLDEIGDMPPDLQGHLLRFLQEGEILRVGGREPIKVDVRVVAATNVRLREAIAAGRLREDLYYRLNVLSIHLPPLRERDGDVEVLAAYFLRQIARELGQDVRTFSADALAAMRSYSWPGNVRELVATVRRAVVLANSDQIQPHDLRLEMSPAPVAPPAFVPMTVSSAPARDQRPDPGSAEERDLIQKVLDEAAYNISRASKALGVSRVTFYRMLQRNRLELRQQCVVQESGQSERRQHSVN